MPTPDFRLDVIEAFTITGRGTGVIGLVVAGGTASGEPLFLHVSGRVTRIEKVSVEATLKDGSEQIALMLYGVAAAEVPPGSVLLAHD